MSNPVLGTLTPSGDLRMEIFKTLMTAKDASGYTRLISILSSRKESTTIMEAQQKILMNIAQEQWTDALTHFDNPICLLCPATLTRITHALEQLKLTEMAFQVSSLCKRLVQAIEWTGDGSEDRPYLVMNSNVAEMWLRDVKKLHVGESKQSQKGSNWRLCVTITTGGLVYFDLTPHARASGLLQAIPATPAPIKELPTPSSTPLAPPAPGMTRTRVPTPGTVTAFNPTETRFGARKPGSRPTLTNIPAPAVTSKPEREPERPEPLSNEGVIAAIKQRMGEPDTILKSSDNAFPMVELYHYKPARRREFHTILSVGMSSLPMHVPEGSEGFRYAELMLLLPPDWQVGKNSLADEKTGWPLIWQIKLAQYVHEKRTWFHHLESFSVGEVGKTLHSSTKFSSWLLVRPETMGTVLDRVTLPDGRTVHFYGMAAIYPEENEFKMRELQGGENLWNRMRAANFTELLFPSRKNLIGQKPSKVVDFPHPQ